MPKRSNPFGDSSPLQLKSHIGKKELDLLSVDSERKMKDVYEKTKSLLYAGALKMSQTSEKPVIDHNSNHTGEPAELIQPCASALLPGQLRIDSSGLLCGVSPDDPYAQESNMDTEMASAAADCPSQPTAPSLLQGQMQIDSSGQLCTAAQVSDVRQPIGQPVCCSCGRPATYSLRPCNFCEKVACRGCLRTCAGCEGLYCSVCSTLNYNDCIEKAYCLHCGS